MQMPWEMVSFFALLATQFISVAYFLGVMHGKLNNLAERMNKLEQRMDMLEQRMDMLAQQLKQQISEFQQQTKQQISEFQQQMSGLDARARTLEMQMQDFQTRMTIGVEKIQGAVAQLSSIVLSVEKRLAFVEEQIK